jgi:hypothetical protein
MDYTAPKCECFWWLCHSKHLLSLVFCSFRPNVLEAGSVSVVNIRKERVLPLDRSPLLKACVNPWAIYLLCIMAKIWHKEHQTLPPECALTFYSLYFSIIWKWVARHFFQPLHLQSKICLYSFNKRLHWLQSHLIRVHHFLGILYKVEKRLIWRSHLFTCLSVFDLVSAFKLLK